jgi:hypothetical protein
VRITRIAAPALALVLALGASGCAGFRVAGCGGGMQSDPMADGASRLNRNFQRHQMVGQFQAYQMKSRILSTSYSSQIRKPGQPAIQQPGSALCY